MRNLIIPTPLLTILLSFLCISRGSDTSTNLLIICSARLHDALLIGTLPSISPSPLRRRRQRSPSQACLDALPEHTSVLAFDTLFHQTIPKEVYTYAIPAPDTETPVPIRKVGALRRPTSRVVAAEGHFPWFASTASMGYPTCPSSTPSLARSKSLKKTSRSSSLISAAVVPCVASERAKASIRVWA